MHPIITIATRAARAAGNIIHSSMSRLDAVEIYEKHPNDYVTEIDRLAEQKIIDVIQKAYPEHAILAEESGTHVGNENVWIIDPLDGTTNFMRGLPHFAVSIALQKNGIVEHGVIYDPTRDELFTATRGKGATLNDRRIRVSKKTSLQGSLIGTGFPYRHNDDLEVYLKTFKSLFPKVGGVRRAGSAALDLAYVAAGRLDGFWEQGLQPWDVAAGALLIKEAGGLVSDFHGGESYLTSKNIVTGNPKIFKSMLQLIKPLIK